MILYPAIDLKDGACVRLRRGDMASATVFSDDPAETAARFRALGFARLHVVDLDGAFAGASRNTAAVAAILSATDVPVQLGGGIRSLAAIEAWLSRGVARVILGTVAARDPALVRQACAEFTGRIVVGIDAREGMVAVSGWADATTLAADELAAAYVDTGVAAIVHTDIGRDGMGTGLNLAETIAIARKVSIPVIASGGFSGMADVARLAAPAAAVLSGAIVGRALYDGSLDPATALKALPQPALAA